MSQPEHLPTLQDTPMGEREEEIDDEFNDDDNDADMGLVTGAGASQSQNNPTLDPQNTNNTNNTNNNTASIEGSALGDIPDLAKNDKTLQEMLELMDGDFAPIIPDAVTDYYLSKNGFETADIRIKRILALATQKFISDIAQDAYEFSRIRSSSAVYNSANPQLRAKQLLQGQQFVNQQTTGSGTNPDGSGEQQTQLHASSAGNQQGKIVLTMDDLSNALSEYGVNTSRPDFYR